jgi:hypothetical protein
MRDLWKQRSAFKPVNRRDRLLLQILLKGRVSEEGWCEAYRETSAFIASLDRSDSYHLIFQVHLRHHQTL